jgi:DNA-binding transcriptional regulator/RsmH inhibitor MraZ
VQPGRTPSWNIVADIEPTAWLEAVKPASADRLPLPVMLRRRVSWCAPESSLALLAAIGAGGEVRVRPLKEEEAEIEAIKTALGTAKPGEHSDLVLSAMAIYSQISLQPDGRLRLSPTLALHLGAVAEGRVWVGAHKDTIMLWSERDWGDQLRRTSRLLRHSVRAVRNPDEPSPD